MKIKCYLKSVDKCCSKTAAIRIKSSTQRKASCSTDMDILYFKLGEEKLDF